MSETVVGLQSRYFAVDIVGLGLLGMCCLLFFLPAFVSLSSFLVC
jgi:hypothetical protein